MNNHTNSQREMGLELMLRELTHKTKNTLINMDFTLLHFSEYLPQLITAYNAAKSHNLITDHIPAKDLDKLSSEITDATNELIQTDSFLNMLTFMSQNYQHETLPRKPVSIMATWHSAVANCPFIKNKSKKHIHEASSDDFNVFIDANLLKQAFIVLLYNTRNRINADSWSLTINTVTQDGQPNLFYLRTSGCFLPDAGVAHLLDKVYWTNKKAWLGCFSCTEIMKLFDGEMTCFEDKGETVFRLKFPATAHML